MNNNFTLPIGYLENKERLDLNIKEDLEFYKTKEQEEEQEKEQENDNRESLIEKILKPDSIIEKENINHNFEYYTNNKLFLKQTQDIIKKLKPKNFSSKELYDKFYERWHNIRNDEKFIDRYYYVDIEFFKFLNNSSYFLQILSLYNILSPVLSLLIPILMLIVPFFMLKMSGVKISISSYFTVLKSIFAKHALGNITNIVDSMSWEKRVYSIISVGFYLFSIYQNSLVCYRFYQNFKDIHEDLFLVLDYLNKTIDNIDDFTLVIKTHNTYSPFLNDIQKFKDECIDFKNNLTKISKFDINHLGPKIYEIGYVMKYFYEIHLNPNVKSLIDYSFGFNAYYENMHSIYNLYNKKIITKCKFGKKLKFKNIYNAYLFDINPVKNDIEFNKNIIITGPNAAGKTTILKSILFNIIFTQIYGLGFYDSATMPLYNKIHCYLNIPDTSGRDSLFQAEARRCKEIIDSLKSKEKHFCVFDELFSGTNPNEACSSSYGFIKYMLNKKIDFILTTHLHELCDNLDRNVNNLNMEVIENDNHLEYTYLLKNGISSIKGGIKVLKDLSYPDEIIKESLMFRSNY